MLVLKRLKDQAVRVYAIEPTGKRLIGTVTRLGGDKLGFEGPHDTLFVRAELDAPTDADQPGGRP